MEDRRQVLKALRLALAPAAVALVLLGAGGAAAATLPTGFQDEVVLEANQPGMEHPVAFKFAPDGRTFVALKGGKILVYPPGATTSTTPTIFANLAKQTYDNGDHGLLGLALDPKFEEGRPYVYALYTFNHELGLPPNVEMPKYPSVGSGVSAYEGDSCPEENRCVVSGRLVRLTAEGNHAKEVGGEAEETVLLEGWCQQSSSHSIGDLGFGPEGALFVSGGEGGIFTNPDYGQYENLCGDPNGTKGTSIVLNPEAEGGSLRSQSIFRPDGQVLLNGTLDRIDPNTGEGWPGNPYAGSANANKDRIVAMGFRNPFRFVVNPRLGEVFVGNVGANTYEEIDRVPIGGPLYNSGWPCYEGLGRNFEFEVLGLNACKRLYETPNSTAAPFFYYSHTTPVAPGDTCPHNSGSAITGSAFYEGSTYPSEYDDALFFADAVRGCIYVMLADGEHDEPDPSTVRPFLSEATNYPGVDLEQGPEGSIYYDSLYEGTINRISYDPGAPTAHLTTTGDPWGAAPLTVHFDASASTGPVGDTFKYEWELEGDGKFDDGSNSPTQQFTYTDGTHNVVAAVRVEDVNTHKSSVAKLTVYPGDSPPKVTIAEPAPSLTWKVGQQLRFAGSAVAREGAGAKLPAADLYWKTRLLHCPFEASKCHEHPIQVFPGVEEGTLGAPDHEFPSFVNFILSATDSRGLTAEASVKVEARPVPLQIRSEPPGILFGVGETKVTTPAEFLAIEGSRTFVAAPETAEVGGVTYSFERWCGGGPRVLEVPTNAAGTYTAIFGTPNGPAGSCGGEGGGGGKGAGGAGSGGPGAGPPAPGPVAPPKLKAHPARQTVSTTARFVFSGPAGSRFRCRLDRGKFLACRSPRVYRRLKPDRHTLRLYATTAAGARSAATVFSWKIVPRP
ncbi:MAG: PQQ-dependent sugar dehydrogenase [Actinobacteria bacterium]|nr:PQQ-dependent sugar dehydrogenase [Actinomycetota bacterium]